MFKARLHRTWVDDMDPFALNVFIPGAVAGGFLVSMALLVGDAIRNLSGGRGRSRRIRTIAAAVAADVRSGDAGAGATRVGLRTDRFYGITGSLSLGIAAAVIPGAAWNFLNPDGYARRIGWVWALSSLGALYLLALGVQVMRLVPRWLPWVLTVLGVVFTVRFSLLVDTGTIPVVLTVGTVATLGLLGLTWKLRHASSGVPPSVRNLAARTPLGASAPDG